MVTRCVAKGITGIKRSGKQHLLSIYDTTKHNMLYITQILKVLYRYGYDFHVCPFRVV